MENINIYESIGKRTGGDIYNQALLIEGLPVDDPVAFSNSICELMTK